MNDRDPNGWVQTYTGRPFWPADPRPGDIHILDIAHALSQCNRFTGQTSFPISVARHSVNVSRVASHLAAPGDKLNCARHGLLHDASEAYLSDVNRILKITPMFAEYRRAEKRLQDMILTYFGLSTEEPPEVKEADAICLRVEAEAGFGVLYDQIPGWVVPTQGERDLVGSLTLFDARVDEKDFGRAFCGLFL